MATDSGLKLLLISICSILSLFVLIIVIKSFKYLSCHKTLVISNKHVYVHIISSHKKKNKLKQKKQTISYSLYTRFATIGSLTSYLLSIIAALYTMFEIVISSNMHRPSQIISFSLWFIARILMNSIFVQRLKFSFSGTKWMYNNRVFTFLYILLFTIIIMGILEIAIFSFHAISMNENIIVIIGFILIILFDIICNIILLILFQRKILQLIKSYFHIFTNLIIAQNTFEEQQKNNILQLSMTKEKQQESSSNPTVSIPSLPSLPSIPSISNNNSNNNKKTKPNKKTSTKTKKGGFGQHLISDSIVINEEFIEDDVEQKPNNKILKVYDDNRLELINNITQYTILIFVSFITSLLTVSMGTIIGATFSQQTYIEKRVNGWFYFLITLVIDNFINSLCLYLHFPFSLKLYKSVCGYKCCLHKCVLLFIAKYLN